MMAGVSKKRYAVGIITATEIKVEYETTSRFKAWLVEMKIGWRELWLLLRGRLFHQTFIAEFS